jgi:probable HAF family extracellular repeat protein
MRPTAIVLLGATLVACSDPVRPSARPSASNTDLNATLTSPAAAFLVARRDLGTLGGRESRAFGVSDAGVVVGWSQTSTGAKRAFTWTASGGMHALRTLAAGKPCVAYHSNRLGQVVGWCNNAAGKQRAVLWSPSGQVRSLGTLPGGTWSVAYDINNAGQVVGTSQADVPFSDIPGTRGFIWTAAGGLHALEAYSGKYGTCPAPEAGAQAINRSGQIAGWSWFDCNSSTTVALRWTADGTIQNAGALSDLNEALGINDLGEMTGDGGETLTDAFIWIPPAQPQRLCDITGGCDPNALGAGIGINNAHQIVGVREIQGSTVPERAFVWTRAGGFQDLGTLPGGNTSLANDINNHTPRQVVGWSSRTGGAIHAALWTLH